MDLACVVMEIISVNRAETVLRENDVVLTPGHLPDPNVMFLFDI